MTMTGWVSKRTTEGASGVEEEEAVLRTFLKEDVTVRKQLKESLKWLLILL